MRCACASGKTVRYTQHRLRAQQSKVTGQREPGRNTPRKGFKLRGCSSLAEPPCVSKRTLLPSINKSLTVFNIFHLFCQILLQRRLERTFSLATGQDQCSHCCGLTSISGWGTEILLQISAGRDHMRSILAKLLKAPCLSSVFWKIRIVVLRQRLFIKIK